MRDLIIFGLPGSGKGTQAKLISQKYYTEIISTGDLLRSVSNGGSVYSKQIFDAIRDGKLVDDSLVCGIVKEKIQLSQSNVGIVFDGFPRNLMQAVFLSSASRDIAVVIELVVGDNLVIERLAGRLLCSNCLAVNNSKLPSFSGVCQYCGSSNLIIRDDDTNAAVIERRIEEYRLQSFVLVEYYGSKVIKIDGARSIEEVWMDVQGSIDLFV